MQYDYKRAMDDYCGRGYRSSIKRYVMLQADPDDPMHGTYSGYSVGCRCERCLEAGRKYQRERYKRLAEQRWAE